VLATAPRDGLRFSDFHLFRREASSFMRAVAERLAFRPATTAPEVGAGLNGLNERGFLADDRIAHKFDVVKTPLTNEGNSPRSSADQLMILFGVIRLGLAVLGEPPDHERRAKTKRHSDWHGKNTPENIHNSGPRFAAEAGKVKHDLGASLSALPLASPGTLRYCPFMLLKKVLPLAALITVGCGPASADVVELKDAAAISGKILAEKRDAIIVDVGYTALVVPRSAVTKIISGEQTVAAKPAPKSKKAAPVASVPELVSAPLVVANQGFYQIGTRLGAEKNVRDLVNQLGQAVVQVRTPGGLGSGWFINEDGFLITNFHVIEGETQISIEVYHQQDGQLERQTYKQVRIVAMNKFADLALLQIQDKDAPKFKYVTIGSADALSVGERVFAIGSPLGLERTVTEGILSTKTRQLGGDLYLQTTTQINPGNSGGPLFNLLGEVVGVTNMKITFGEGLGFAIPAEVVRYFLDHRDAYAYSNDNPSNAYRYLEPPGRIRQNSEND
jgi:serine protease Do